MEELGLSNIINKPVRTLSLGQRMLGEISLALIHSPKILILDEPTIGLDILIKDKLEKFLTRLNQQKKTTIIMSSHDLYEISKLCNKLLVLNRGRVIYSGLQNDLLQTSEKELKIKIIHEKSNAEFNMEDTILRNSSDTSKEIIINLDSETSLKKVIDYVNTRYLIKNIEVKKPDLSEVIIRLLSKKEGEYGNRTILHN